MNKLFEIEFSSNHSDLKSELKNNLVFGLKSLLLILVAFFVAFQVEAQSLSDIQNIKVDNLSDAQIEQLIKRAEASGLTSNQLVGMARERGMPAAEAMKLSQRISQLQSAANSTGTGIGSTGGRSMTGEQGIDMFDSLRRSDPYYDLTPTQKKIFGYKLFHNRSLDFSPSLKDRKSVV